MAKMYVMLPYKKGTIAPEIYGHFTEHIGGVIYDGIWVGKNSKIPNYDGFRKEIVDKLRAIKAPVFRWPGGCFTEAYNWRDGIGQNRSIKPSWWTRWDGKYETNEVGTHEFFRFCELVGAKSYIAANITSMTPQDMRDYMDYCTSPRGKTTLALEREKNGHPEPFKVDFWGIGNENWGGGGNMTPEHYGNLYRQYSEPLFNVAPKDCKLVSCGQSDFQYDWTRRFLGQMMSSGKKMHGMSFHYYVKSAEKYGEAISFSDNQWYAMLADAWKMDEIIERTWGIVLGNCMENHGKIVVDEWGAWHPDGSGPSKGANLFEQQSTMRDAVLAALTLNIFNSHADKIMMANVAQLVNNIHCLFLTSGDKCLTTPTYHVFDMYKNHMGAQSVGVYCDTKDIAFENNGKDGSVKNLSYSASVKNGFLTITAANLDIENAAELDLEVVGANSICDKAMTKILCHENIRAVNTFDNPCEVKPELIEVDIKKPITVPAASVISVEIKIS